MKLRQWLRENKNMSYLEYTALPDDERWKIAEEHRRFCIKKQIHDSKGWRPMTEEEKKNLDLVLAKEKERYEISLKIGGIDERGNYTALHNRWYA